jgi:hypothetical protein
VQKAISNSIGLRKTTALAIYLCCWLHNYCINCWLQAEEALYIDSFHVECFGGVTVGGAPASMSDVSNYQ